LESTQALATTAEHDAMLPPSVPEQLQLQGPEPPTADGAPAEQSLEVGAMLTAVPLEAPHAPFADVGVGVVAATTSSVPADPPQAAINTAMPSTPAALRNAVWNWDFMGCLQSINTRDSCHCGRRDRQLLGLDAAIF
jgi:hypothetical protein